MTSITTLLNFFLKHQYLLDFSKYPKDTKYFDQANKKVIGKMKEVFEGKVIGESVGLKSKMHSMKTIIGVNIATEFSEFKDPLFSKKVVRHKMKRIQSKKHKIGAYEINKISSPCFDHKRFALNDGIHTLAYFHKDTDWHKWQRFSQ